MKMKCARAAVLSALTLLAALPVGLAAAPAQASFPGNNGLLAGSGYGSFPGGSNQFIYTVRPDGTYLDVNYEGAFPAWSPSGNKIAYVGYAYATNEEWQLWTTNPSTQVTHYPTRLDDPISGMPGVSWSADGSQLVFSALPPGTLPLSLSVINADGTNEHVVGEGEDPHWSPDGSKILFVKGGYPNADIFTMNPDGSGVANLTPGGAGRNSSPDWSPGGDKIVFTSDRDNPGGAQSVYTMNPDGTNQVILPNTTGLEDPAWSPDGTKMAFIKTCCDYPAGLGIMNADGTNQQAVIGPDGSPPYYVPPGEEPGLRWVDWQPLRPPGYARPKTATPTTVRLVPAYEPCTNSNASHGAPLALPSCNPPQSTSDYLTVGTPDSPNGAAANSVGSVTMKAIGESPINLNNGDQSDVAFTILISDVRDRQTFADYMDELRASFGLRLTDRLSGAGAVHPATVTDTTFGFSFSCSATGAGIGSTCSASTSADAVMPGITPEFTRAIWQLGQVEVYDGGADGDGDTTGDNTLFATQGLFTP